MKWKRKKKRKNFLQTRSAKKRNQQMIVFDSSIVPAKDHDKGHSIRNQYRIYGRWNRNLIIINCVLCCVEWDANSHRLSILFFISNSLKIDLTFQSECIHYIRLSQLNGEFEKINQEMTRKRFNYWKSWEKL